VTDSVNEADAEQAASRGFGGAAMVVLLGVALVVALYLTWAKLAGAPVVCGPLGGCDTVETSPYAAFLGIPVAAFGAGATTVALIGAFMWWRRAERRGLLAAYVIGLISLPILAYLAFLELAVIHAVCVWCVTYALLTIAGWLVSVREMRH
jgi:uncharacterized membrane protein